MFTSSKFAAVCLAVTALFNDVNAEAEVAQTFGLLGSGYRASSNAGPYGAPSGGVHGGGAPVQGRHDGVLVMVVLELGYMDGVQALVTHTAAQVSVELSVSGDPLVAS